MRLRNIIAGGILGLLLPFPVFAQLNTHQGGTGVQDVAAGSILFGSVTNIRMATSSALQFSNSLSKLSFTFGSSTAFSATTICLTGDTCRTTWPASAAGVPLATTSFAATAPIQIATTPLITYSILAASASQAGSMSLGDFQLLHTATSTFTSPLIYTLGTNAVTLQAASASQIGSMSAGDYQLLHTATTTFSSPLVYTLSTNAVTCPTCSTNTFAYPFTFLVNPSSTFGTSTNATTSSLWLKGGSFFSSSTQASQFPYASTTAITATNASTTNLTVDTGHSALALFNTTGVLGNYGGAAACTNQVVTAISAVGGTTCTTVANAMLQNQSVTVTAGTGMAGGGAVNLGSAITLYSTGPVATSTNGETAGNIPYYTSTNGTPALISGGDTTFTFTSASKKLVFLNGTSTNLSATGSFFPPTTTALPTNFDGSVAINTTAASSSIQFGSGKAAYASTTASFTYPTSTPAGTTTNLFVQNGNRGYKVDNIECLNRGATASSTIEIGNGVSTTTYQAGFTIPIPLTLATPLLIDAWKTLYINIGTWGSTNISSVACGTTKEYSY